jgi:dCTP deaminase
MTLENALPDGEEGVLPRQLLAMAVSEGVVDAGNYKVLPDYLQPASLDLRLGSVAYRVRCSFLPDDRPVADKLKELTVAELPLDREGAVLETNRPYIIPLIERLNLPPKVRGKANPKSSTGRLDVFTRVITDNSYRFDEIEYGYCGPLYLEVVPLSFAVEVRQLLSLSQLRLAVGRLELDDDSLRRLHDAEGLLYRAGRRLEAAEVAFSNGIFLSLDLQGDAHGRVGYRAKKHTPLIEASKVRNHEARDFWDPVYRDNGDRIILDPETFYLLMSEESVHIPPGYAAEMTAYDPTSGELRTHYAGFFDPGFGHDPSGIAQGSRAALEVRAHDVPFMIEHGQRVCKLTFERMLRTPDSLYGSRIGSHYQNQFETLSKHFRVPSPPATTQPAPPQREDHSTEEARLFYDA